MKRISKILLSVILVATIAFGATSFAFADEASVSSIPWTDLQGDDYTVYYGKKALVEGENEISIYDVYLDVGQEDGELIIPIVYYDFEAEESGYYYFHPETSWFAVAETFDGSAANGCCETVTYGDETESIVYIEKGKTIIGTYFLVSDFSNAWDTMVIEYLGAEIEDYNIDEGPFDDYLIGWNIWEDDSGYFGLCGDCEVSFSSGKTLEMTNVEFHGTCSTVPQEGENEATIEFFGVEKDIVFTAFYLENLIESVELTNLENYTEFTVDYTGSRRYESCLAELLTVRFTDGTETSSVVADGMTDIVLPNGVLVPAYAGLQENPEDGTYDFIITVAYMNFGEYEVTERENSFNENLTLLSEDNFFYLHSAGDDLITGVQYLIIDPEFSLVCFKQIFADLSQIITNISAFAEYYFTI